MLNAAAFLWFCARWIATAKAAFPSINTYRLSSCSGCWILQHPTDGRNGEQKIEGSAFDTSANCSGSNDTRESIFSIGTVAPAGIFWLFNFQFHAALTLFTVFYSIFVNISRKSRYILQNWYNKERKREDVIVTFIDNFNIPCRQVTLSKINEHEYNYYRFIVNSFFFYYSNTVMKLTFTCI